MQISLDSTFKLIVLLIILILLLNSALPRRVPKPSQNPCLRRRRANPQNQPHAKNKAKPAWVKAEVLRLLALLKDAGCRTIASTFNAKFASRGESVSKSYVAQLKKKSRYEWMRLRKEYCKPLLVTIEREQTFWLYSSSQRHSSPAGVIDHGSRKNVAFTFTDKSAAAVLNLIKNLTNTFGKPKAIRTDNDGAFVGDEFKASMKSLGIRHQRSDPHCPWQNGRIERFFGTFKSTIRHIQIDTHAALQQAIDEFRFHYNHIRPHQNLGNRTPEMAWTGKVRYPRSQELRWFAAWEGVLCGWLHVPKAQRLQRQNS